MKLTCLSEGKGYNYPPCHILSISGYMILIDCPLDLSALAVFSPVPTYFKTVKDGGETLDCSESNNDCSEKPLVASDLIFSEPWYKTVTNLHLWNVSFIDIVLVSSPMGMLGLPFLIRMKGFSAKVYVTEASARLGELMMEDLVSMQMEFRQFYGYDSNFPKWMHWEELERLPSKFREIILGEDGTELGGWMAPYSAADVKHCMQRVQRIKFGEEVCFNGTLLIKACSSGLDIGTCNWTIKSPKKHISCISSSIFNSDPAMDFDYHALQGSDLILYSDFSPLDAAGNIESDNNSSTILTTKSMSIEGCGSYNSNAEELLTCFLSSNECLEKQEKLEFICSYAVDSVKTGGSVLIPIDHLGITLLLLEQISMSLDASGSKAPIYMISSVAEEMLAFTNIIPEWLCKQRQDKLFSGEPLFAHVNLMKDKRLQVFSAVHSPKLLTSWQEPCIVFSPHWNLRLGPVVHFLWRWCQDPKSLLILESGLDAELALLPFKPVEMKVLQCSLLSQMKLQKVKSLLKILKPKAVLLPQKLTQQLIFSDVIAYRVCQYSGNRTLSFPSLNNHHKLLIDSRLVSEFHHKDLNDKMKIIRLKGKLIMLHGKHQLLYEGPGTASLSRALIHWGSPDVNKLNLELSKMGIQASMSNGNANSENACILCINKPSEALIEIRETSTVICTADQNLASLLFYAVSQIIGGV